MKVKFEFNMPDDRELYNLYSNAPAMHSALYELSKFLRSMDKHSDDTHIAIDLMRDRFYMYIREADVDLTDL